MKRAEHIEMTEREFRKWKRKQFQDLKKAFDEFRLGCAYSPITLGQIGSIDHEIDSIFNQCKDWWKKA